MVYVKKTFKKSPVKKYSKRPVKKARIYPMPSIVKQYIKKAISRNAENKSANPVIQSNASIVPMSSTTWGNMVTLSAVWENVTQGTGQSGRVGNKIKPVYWNIKGSIQFNVSVTGTAIVKMFVFKSLTTFKSPGDGGALPVDFFQTGNTVTSPSQNLADLYRRVNKDKYKVYTTRMFKIGQSAASTASSNNDFSAMRFFNINLLKYQKHIISYNDSSFEPINSGLFLGFVACSVNDAAISANTLKISYDITGNYEDM